MQHAVLLGFVSVAVAVGAMAPATAQESMPARQYVVDLGGGGILKPRYPGSDDTIFLPYPIIEVGRLYLPVLGQVADGQEKIRGISVFPSFGFNGNREASDDPSLRGTREVDWTFELGGGVAYRYDWLRGFVSLRQAFNGSDGQVGEIGLDVITTPAPRIELRFGPRADFASSDYMETYFGVTRKEAARGPLSAYDPDGGFMSFGLAAKASYEISPRTRVHLVAGWDRYVGSAADSPIVKHGSRDQFSVGLGLSYRFAFDLFR